MSGKDEVDEDRLEKVGQAEEGEGDGLDEETASEVGDLV
jgi:hypothetical protein